MVVSSQEIFRGYQRELGVVPVDSLHFVGERVPVGGMADLEWRGTGGSADLFLGFGSAVLDEQGVRVTEH